jgi:hypothetical protein
MSWRAAEEEDVAVAEEAVVRAAVAAQRVPAEGIRLRQAPRVQPARKLDQAPAETKRLPRDPREVVLPEHKAEPVPVPARAPVARSVQPRDSVRPLPVSAPPPDSALQPASVRRTPLPGSAPRLVN